MTTDNKTFCPLCHDIRCATYEAGSHRAPLPFCGRCGRELLVEWVQRPTLDATMAEYLANRAAA
jgi:hypothetical protein